MPRTMLNPVKNPLSNIGIIWSLPLKDTHEESDLKDFLEDSGYTPDPSGLNKFLMDVVYEEEPEQPGVEKIAEVLHENNEIVSAVGNKVKRSINNFLKNKIGL